MLAFVFPGQGSQRRGMGQGLFDEVPEFLAKEREIDQCLGYSIRTLCLEDPGSRLKETQYTQPCLYIVNALHYYKAVAQGMRPSFFAGHSLGEYNALLAAGAFDLITGLRLVQKRGEMMSKVKNGGMAAIIGLNAKRVKQLLEENGFSGLDVANYNSEAQIVLTGMMNDINRAAPIFEKANAKLYMPLLVSAAFHSRYMSDVAAKFGDFLNAFTFYSLHTPVISNVTGEPYPSGDSSAAIRSLLSRQICSSVLWMQSVRYMLTRGVTAFKEIGPGDVLTQLVQRIQMEELSEVAVKAM
ncbi:MAG: ACP S-malonyltransferase [Terracidiphilus sp.]|jgi:malonyl CoA-acyl carrier protein transacylase